MGVWFGKALPFHTSGPGGKMPPSTAAKMAAATDVNPTLNKYWMREGNRLPSVGVRHCSRSPVRVRGRKAREAADKPAMALPRGFGHYGDSGRVRRWLMMTEFDKELAVRLDAIRAQGLYRELRRINSPQLPHTQVDGRRLLNFSSNDYLGLANDPVLKEAAIKGIERYGAGSGASRLVCGSLAPHHDLEQAIAAFKGAEAALVFSSGHASALG